MDKEEILRKSREEGNDEGEEQLHNKVHRAQNSWGVLLAMLTLIVLRSFGFIEHWVTSLVFLVMIVPSLIYGIYGYRRSKQTEYLATIVVGLIGLVLFSSNLYSAWMGG